MTKLALVPTLQKNETLQSLECEELWKHATSSKGRQVDPNAKLTKQLINEVLELHHTIPIFDPQHSHWYIAKYD
jgi:hypothetical protein